VVGWIAIHRKVVGDDLRRKPRGGRRRGLPVDLQPLSRIRL
jgi:hypothetical protein